MIGSNNVVLILFRKFLMAYEVGRDCQLCLD